MKQVPLVIFGLDAGDPQFIQEWVREGSLPTIASVMQRGWWGKTTGPEFVLEHGTWVSLLSGISRGEHGYYYYRQLAPGTYDLRPMTGYDVEALPFWSGLRGRQKPVAIIDAPDARLISGLPGLQLANWATHNSWDPLHYMLTSDPPALVQEVVGGFGPQLPVIEKIESTLQEDRQLYGELLSRVERKGRLCRHLLERGPFDLIVMVFAESHAANHQFWKYRPEISEDGSAGGQELAGAIRGVYQAIDREIGQTMALLPDPANVVIVSSIGMADKFPNSGLMDSLLRRLGYQVPRALNRASFRPMDVVRRIVPEEWRIAVSRRFSRETRERLLADQFRHSIDWARTKVFAEPGIYVSHVRLNLKGRQPQGTVEPGAEYEAVLDRIEAELKQLVDPATNEPAVAQITRTTAMFGGGPPASLPDMFVDWKHGRFMERVVHPTGELIQKKPEFFRRSDHSLGGFVALAGPSISRRGMVGDVPLLDLAPTFLSLMGEPIPPTMKGRPMPV